MKTLSDMRWNDDDAVIYDPDSSLWRDSYEDAQKDDDVHLASYRRRMNDVNDVCASRLLIFLLSDVIYKKHEIYLILVM